MVKKYFRPFIISVCTAISVLLGAGNVVPMYIAAAELPMEMSDGTQAPGETEVGTEEATPTETAPETEAPAEAATEAVTEAATETVTEAETEPVTEAAAGETTDTAAAQTETDTGAQTQPATEQLANETAETIGAGTPAPVAETETESKGAQETEDSVTGQDGTQQVEESESEKETAKDTKAAISVGQQSYGLGDDVSVTVDKYADSNATAANLEFDIPSFLAFKGIGNKPAFKDRTAKIMYKDAGNEWKEYSDSVNAGDVKGIRIQIDAEEGKTGIVQEDKLLVTLTAINRGDAEIQLKTSAKHGEDDASATASASVQVAGEVADIVMTQDPEAPLQGSEVKQTTDVTYKMEADTVLTYTVDPGVDLLGLKFEPGSIFIGGNAVVTSSAGDAEVEIAMDMDLSSYTGITSVKLTPKAKAEKDAKNTFTATLLIHEDTAAYTNKLSVVAGPEDNQLTAECSQTFTVDNSTIDKPVLTYDGGLVPFEEDCVIGLGGMNVHMFKDIQSLEYTLSTPAFAAIHEIQLPGLTGASSIAVYAKAGEEESLLGEYKPGDVVTVDKEGISGFRFVFTLEGKDMEVTQDGSITLAVINKEHRLNYFAFRATMKAVVNEVERTATSEILSVTFGVYQKPEPETEPVKPDVPPETEAPSNPQPTPPAIETPETETEDDGEPSEYEKYKEEEEEKKQSIIDKTLEADETTKELQKEILANRIASIRSNAIVTGGSGANGGGAGGFTAEDFEDWLVKPINESMVENLVPAEINPIDEAMVEDLTSVDA